MGVDWAPLALIIFSGSPVQNFRLHSLLASHCLDGQIVRANTVTNNILKKRVFSRK